MFKISPLVPLGLGLLLVACESPTAPEPNAALGPADATSAELNTWSTKASILAARVFGWPARRTTSSTSSAARKPAGRPSRR